MQNIYEIKAIGAILLGLGLSGFASAQDCVPIKGKIFNNALGPGSTLGTAHVIFGQTVFLE